MNVTDFQKNELLVYQLIKNNIHKLGYCFLTNNDIAGKLKMNYNSVANNISNLQKYGVLSITKLSIKNGLQTEWRRAIKIEKEITI